MCGDFGCWDLVERWSGRGGVWSQEYYVTGEFEGLIEGVAMTSPTNVWAVGYYNPGAWWLPPQKDAPLILRWDGSTWKVYDP